MLHHTHPQLMELPVEYVRKWKVGELEFDSKAEAQRYEAEAALGRFATVADMIANADELVDLLKPFCTPKTRKRKGNGTEAETGVPKAHAPRSKRGAEPHVAE